MEDWVGGMIVVRWCVRDLGGLNCMPIYEYQAVEAGAGCARCRERFEVRQSMREDALTVCPSCGKRIRRMICAVGISTQQSTKSMLSNSNLKAKGFTKLVNEGGGKFRKTT
jgi:putative FmdB family regulatory protein